MYTDRLTNFYASLSAVLAHELYHIWFEIKGPNGIRPNPLPGDPGWNPNPTVQVLNGLGQGVTMTFNIQRPNGSIDSVQYGAYEHVLIHDEMVWQYGVDEVWTGLMDAMTKASSVTTTDGTNITGISASGAQAYINAKQLEHAQVFGRPDSPGHAPSVPNYSGACNQTWAQSVQRALAGSRATRDYTDGNGVEYYNLDGYDLIWTGVMPPADP